MLQTQFPGSVTVTGATTDNSKHLLPVTKMRNLTLGDKVINGTTLESTVYSFKPFKTPAMEMLRQIFEEITAQSQCGRWVRAAKLAEGEYDIHIETWANSQC